MKEKTPIEKFKLAIDSENLTSLFYKYISKKAKNGTVKRKFYEIYREAEFHRDLLTLRLRQITGQDYQPESDLCKEKGTPPASFSLLGAVNVARESELKSVRFYKEMIRKEKDKLNKDIFKFILNQEEGHLRLLKKEKLFLRHKEVFKPLAGLDFLQRVSALWRY